MTHLDRDGHLHAGRRFAALSAGVGLGCALTAGLFGAGCQDTDLLKPGSIETNVLTAHYIPNASFDNNPIELNGEVKEAEWGGPLDRDITFHQIRMSRDDGAGDPGEPIFVAMKAIYTDSDLYFLVQWIDGEANEMKDATYYYGPDLFPDTLGLYTGRCPDFLVSDQTWSRIPPGGTRPEDEDRMTLCFEIEPTSDEKGTFREQGCQVACHVGQNPAWGAPAAGRLDVWMWLSTRTNLLRDLYDRRENANAPLRGTPAYLDDFVSDPVAGLTADPGTAGWRQNWEDGHTYPSRVYRPGDDPLGTGQPNCRNDFGEECRANNRLPVFYPFQESADRFVFPFGACDTVNLAVLPAGREPRKWVRGDAVAGYWFTYPSGSRADVHGKAQFAEPTSRWTLELGRRLRTGDDVNDVTFSGQPGDEVYFTVAVANNSGTVHWGSGPQRLRFGAKPTTAPRGGL